MSALKNKLIKMGAANPSLRPHLRPVLAELEKTASPAVAGWDSPEYRVFDDWGLRHLSREGKRALARAIGHIKSLCQQYGMDTAQVMVRGPDHPDTDGRGYVEIHFYHSGKVAVKEANAFGAEVQRALSRYFDRLPELADVDMDAGEWGGHVEFYDFIYLHPQ